MDSEKFNSIFWNYYSMLEDNVVNLSRYVDIRKSNFKTCSNEIISQLLNVGSEIDVICKEICTIDENARKEMKTYSKWFINNFDDIDSVKIFVRNTDLILQPFEGWKKTKSEELPWWKAYNSVKHDRSNNFEQGNLKNLINSLGALYFFEMFYIKKLDNEKGTSAHIDVPKTPSKLFKIDKWVTKFSVIGYNFYIDYEPGI